MYSLWIKIFVWFWVAMVFVGAALVVVVGLTQPDLPDSLGGPRPLTQNWRGFARAAFTEHARRTFQAYNRGSNEALRRELGRLKDEFGIEAVVFDAAGDEITGFEAPRRARGLARQSQRSGRPETAATTGGSLLVAIPGRGPQPITVVGLLPRPYGSLGASPFGLLLRLVTVLLTGGLVCYLLSRHLTSPLATLQKAVHGLADGDLQTRVSAGALGRRGDEFGELARDFDRMAERLQSLVERQQILLSDISHELRSPLARLSVALGLARDRAGEDSDPALERIGREVANLDMMIQHLLQLSRLEKEQALSTSPVNLPALLSQVVEDSSFEGSVDDRGVVFEPTQTIQVEGDARLLHSAFENVVRNALAHTPDGGEVRVGVKLGSDRTASVWIRDQGPGVSDELLPQIFEPFFRADPARGVGSGNVGLGLSITRRIIQLHGGRIVARNRPGGGLEVEIVLPSLEA